MQNDKRINWNIHRETPESVASWGETVFGPVKDPFQTVARGYGEFGELLEAAVKSDGSHEAIDHICEEAADVAMVLIRLASAAGIPFSMGGELDETDTQTSLTVVSNRLAAMLMTAKLIPMEQLARSALGGDLYWAWTALGAICVEHGSTLWTEIDLKMAENRVRDWTPAGRARRRAASILSDASAVIG